LPLALWIAVIVARNGEFYDHELVRWREIVWIMDTLREHGLSTVARKWLSNLDFFAYSSLRQTAPALAVLAATLFLGWPERHALPVVLAGLRQAFLPLALILATELSFFASVGYRVERLAFSSSVIVGFVCALVCVKVSESLPPRRRKLLVGTAWLIVLLWGVACVVKDGPYF
jgi:hypothetical protein